MTKPICNNEMKCSVKPSAFNILKDSLQKEVEAIHKDVQSRIPSMTTVEVPEVEKNISGKDKNDLQLHHEANIKANRKLAVLIDKSLEESFNARLRSVQVDILSGDRKNSVTDRKKTASNTGNKHSNDTETNQCIGNDSKTIKSFYDQNKPVSKELLAQRQLLACSLKRKGDAEFKAGRAVEAVECYSSSVDLSRATNTYSNRAAALLKVGRYHESERDSCRVLSMCRRDATPEDTKLRVKAFFRRALARQQLNQYEDALTDLESVLLLEPSNKRAQNLKETITTQTVKHKKKLNVPRTLVEFDTQLIKMSISRVMSMYSFMEQWLQGVNRKDKKNFNRTFDATFVAADCASFITAATGEILSKTAFARNLYEMHGARKGYNPSFVQEPRNPLGRTVVPCAGKFGICTIVTFSNKVMRRRATAIFRWKQSATTASNKGKNMIESVDEKIVDEFKSIEATTMMDIARVELVHLHESIISSPSL